MKRGCNRPGGPALHLDRYGEPRAVYRSTSPTLHDTPDDKLYECPVGYLLREAPWVFDIVHVAACCEHAGFDVLRQSAFTQCASRLVLSEVGRHRERRMAHRQAKSDAGYGAAVLRGRGQ